MIDLERKKYFFEKMGYTPHSPKQWEIHDSQARFRILACGRRYGKTTFGANELTAAMLDPEQAGIYWIVGPKYTTAEKEFRIVYWNFMKRLGLRGQIKASYNVKQGDMRIEIPRTGTILEVKSAQHQDTLLGEGLKGVIMAEAARHSPDTWSQYVRPALSDIAADGERGWAIFTSTPRGYNWFQGLWLLGQHPDHSSYESWCLPSWENPIVYPGGRNDPEILQEEEDMKGQPGKFEQEIAAEFTAFSGKIYKSFNRNIHVKRIKHQPLWTNVWALDYGWANPFVCLDVMIDLEDNFYVWREYVKSEMTTFDHAKYLNSRDNPPDYHVDWAAGDPRGPDQANTIEDICRVDISSEDIGDGNAHESWQLGIDHVSRLLAVQADGRPKLFIDESCTETIRQMEQLRRVEDDGESKNPREGQHKHDDHCPDALRYLVGQYFEGGAGAALSDVYSALGRQSEAATFFQHEARMDRYARF